MENVEKNSNAENTEPRQKKAKKSRENQSGINSFRAFLDGSILARELVIRQLPFILFLAFLAILYIGNRYQAEKIIRKTAQIQSELKELRSEHIAINSELMQLSKQSQIAKLAIENGLELEESTEPAKKIEIEEE